MKLDENNPCPHCGHVEPLTKDREMKSVIPEELQYNFSNGIQDLANREASFTFDDLYGDIAANPKISQLVKEYPGAEKPETKTVSLNLPLEFLFPHLEHTTLDPASLKVYFQLAIEYQIILKNAKDYQEGAYRWNIILPDRLQEYGLTLDAWNKISSIGDNDPIIQGELKKILAAILQKD